MAGNHDKNDNKKEINNCAPKVTLLIPSLNVAGYIAQTLESAVNQSLKEIEILCIDAGSSDGTLDVISTYQERDTRIRLMHSDVKSYGHQMNMGISEAKGEYIGIVESDDYVDRNMYRDLYEVASENCLDIVKSDYYYFFDYDNNRDYDKIELKLQTSIDYDTVYSCEEYIKGRYGMEPYIWNAIYKTEFLRTNGIRFNETPKAAFQDFGFKYLTCMQAERIMAINKAYYYYRKNNIESSTYNPNVLKFTRTETAYVRKMLLHLIQKDMRIYELLTKDTVYCVINNFNELCMYNENESAREDMEEYVSLIEEIEQDGVILRECLDVESYSKIMLMKEDLDLYIKSTKIMCKAQANIGKELKEWVDNRKNVIIFGAGPIGRCATTFLKACGLSEKMVAYADNNPKKQGAYINDIEILSPEECVDKYNESNYIITVPGYRNDILKQLEDLGVSRDRTITYNYSTKILTCARGMIAGAQT